MPDRWKELRENIHEEMNLFQNEMISEPALPELLTAKVSKDNKRTQSNKHLFKTPLEGIFKIFRNQFSLFLNFGLIPQYFHL